MKATIKIFIAVLCMIYCTFPASAETKFGDETLNYVITYKWGLITKDSGDATLSLKNQGSKYKLEFIGKTKPWADKFFKVRDTLVTVMDKANFRPLSYTRVAHEGGNYDKDFIEFTYSGPKVTGKGSRFRDKKGKTSTRNLDMSASGPTFDIISVFYWLRTVDPATMQPGKKVTATLFSGANEETIKLWKVGEEKLKMRDGSQREAWHMRFTFTSKGGKKTSDDIDVWLSKDSKRIPLEVKGKLPIGHASAYLVN